MLVIWIVIFLIVIHSLLLYFEKKILKISSRKFPIPILETRQRPPWSVLF